jgi:hypothetical protein
MTKRETLNYAVDKMNSLLNDETDKLVRGYVHMAIALRATWSDIDEGWTKNPDMSVKETQEFLENNGLALMEMALKASFARDLKDSNTGSVPN